MASGIFPNLFLLMVSVFVYHFLVFERSVNENLTTQILYQFLDDRVLRV